MAYIRSYLMSIYFLFRMSEKDFHPLPYTVLIKPHTNSKYHSNPNIIFNSNPDPKHNPAPKVKTGGEPVNILPLNVLQIAIYCYVLINSLAC